jgi:hypothetical protein
MKFFVSTTTTTVLALALAAFSVDARIGDQSSRRRLQHRKLQWAEDDRAIKDQFIVIFGNDASEEGTKEAVDKWVASNEATEVVFSYGSAYKGVVLKSLQFDSLLEVLDDSLVAFVEEVRMLCSVRGMFSISKSFIFTSTHETFSFSFTKG